MENKIDISELLKDCPKGMELDCPIFKGLEFDHIDENNGAYPIICRVKTEWGSYNIHTFTEYGCYSTEKYSKCVILPKGKTTWEGFVPPCKFKEGDVLVSEAGNIVLLSNIDSKDRVNHHCIISTYDSFRIEENTSIGVGRYYDCVLANEQQRQRMYDTIKSSGYKYNQNTNKLEKLVEPKFKVGDRIKHKEKTRWVCTIARVEDRYYVDGHPMCYTLPFGKQDEYELVPNKFDIYSLKPFDKVLIKNANVYVWTVSFFSHIINSNQITPITFVLAGGYPANHCIPYEGNQHLLGTRNDCDEYYKTWEE